jgi:hypothetical protein
VEKRIDPSFLICFVALVHLAVFVSIGFDWFILVNLSSIVGDAIKYPTLFTLPAFSLSYVIGLALAKMVKPRAPLRTSNILPYRRRYVL